MHLQNQRYHRRRTTWRPPSISDEEINRWKQWWMIPMYVGVADCRPLHAVDEFLLPEFRLWILVLLRLAPSIDRRVIYGTLLAQPFRPLDPCPSQWSQREGRSQYPCSAETHRLGIEKLWTLHSSIWKTLPLMRSWSPLTNPPKVAPLCTCTWTKAMMAKKLRYLSGNTRWR